MQPVGSANQCKEGFERGLKNECSRREQTMRQDVARCSGLMHGPDAATHVVHEHQVIKARTCPMLWRCLLQHKAGGKQAGRRAG